MNERSTVDPAPRLRTFWRILVAWLGFLLIELIVALGALPLARLSAYLYAGVHAAAIAAALIGFVVVMTRFVDRRPWSQIGLTFGWRALPQLLLGLLVPLGAVATAVAVGIALGWLRQVAPWPSLTPATAGLLAFQLCLVGVSEAFPEELLFRGYLFRNLSDVLAIGPAWLVTAVLFGSLHVISSSGAVTVQDHLMYVVAAVGLGLATTSARIVTGGLWASVGIHLGFIFFQGLIPFGPTTQADFGPFMGLLAGAMTVAALAVYVWSRLRGVAGPR